MKYLITGGLGFIGSNIATLLSHNNQEVVILDNLDPMYGATHLILMMLPKIILELLMVVS